MAEEFDHVSKRIALTDEAYDRLAARKRDDETFSEVVLRLTEERSLLELAGALTGEEADALESAIRDRRARRHEALEHLHYRLQETRE